MNPSLDATDLAGQEMATPRQKLSAYLSDHKRSLITTASILGGGSTLAWGIAGDGTPASLASTPSDELNPSDDAPVLETDRTLSIPGGTIRPNADVQIATVDDTSFGEAFASAREQVGPGGVFIWEGNVYNTFYKEEWAALPLGQRQEFLRDVGFRASATEAAAAESVSPEAASEPTMMDMAIGSQRIVGIDYDNDGLVDTIVLPAGNGYEVHIVDSQGDEGLDTAFVYDSRTDDVLRLEKLSEPFIITTDEFDNGVRALDAQVRLTESEALPTYPVDSEADNEADGAIDMAETPDDENAQNSLMM